MITIDKKNTEHWDLFSISTMRTFLSVSSPQEECSIGGEPNDHKNHICSPFKQFWSSFGWQSWHLQYFFSSAMLSLPFVSYFDRSRIGLNSFLFISYVLWPSPFSVILSPYSIFFATKSQYFFLFIYLDCRVFVCFFLDKLPERGKSFYGFF